MYDVTLYGHLTIDRVIEELKESLSLGAIANSWEALGRIDSSLSVKLNPTSQGEAIILVDKERNFRLGQPLLNLKVKNKVEVERSRWHHIMYLNSLHDASFIADIESGIVSADITVGNKQKNLEYLKYIDYLFVSDEDLFMDLESMAKLVKGWVILHYPAGSLSTDGNETYKHDAQTVDGLNVLGAGDIFASSFIFSHLKDENSIQNSVKFAHEKTLELLLEKNVR
jgi:hypothetical protein